MSCENKCQFEKPGENGIIPCGWMRWLVDFGYNPKCSRLNPENCSRVVDEQPEGFEINVNSYGPQTREELDEYKRLIWD